MQLTWSSEVLRLRSPFRIARSTTVSKEAIVVRLEHNGVTGYGEAVASIYYHQSRTAIEETLTSIQQRLDQLADPFDLLAALDRLITAYPTQPAALAALDAAVHDWIGCSLGLPVHRFLGIDPHVRLITAFTLGITAPAAIEQDAAAAVAAGQPIIKLKVGLPTLAEEVALLEALRRGAPDVTLYLDANGGWTSEQANERIAVLAAYRPTLIEQPIAPGQLDALAHLSDRSPVPLFADEDALGVSSIPRLWNVVSGVNIKLPKCGGIRPALAMIHAARSGGLQVMLGCMVASSLGLAPAVQLAPLADHLDLDGHLLLAHDPWMGLSGAHGQLRLTDLSGLGVSRRQVEAEISGAAWEGARS